MLPGDPSSASAAAELSAIHHAQLHLASLVRQVPPQQVLDELFANFSPQQPQSAARSDGHGRGRPWSPEELAKVADPRNRPSALARELSRSVTAISNKRHKLLTERRLLQSLPAPVPVPGPDPLPQPQVEPLSAEQAHSLNFCDECDDRPTHRITYHRTAHGPPLTTTLCDEHAERFHP